VKRNDNSLTKHGIFDAHAPTHMDLQQMSQYKYHIDIGGGGGTSWKGTLTKLSLPGLLFHQETPTMDWFYPQMIPWEHYVPIQWDLSDLASMYQWAEAHPEDAKRISRSGTELAYRIMGDEYLKLLYQHLFVDTLGQLVHAYDAGISATTKSKTTTTTTKNYNNMDHGDHKHVTIEKHANDDGEIETLDSLLQYYQSQGFVTYEVSKCIHGDRCWTYIDHDPNVRKEEPLPFLGTELA